LPSCVSRCSRFAPIGRRRGPHEWPRLPLSRRKCCGRTRAISGGLPANLTPPGPCSGRTRRGAAKSFAGRAGLSGRSLEVSVGQVGSQGWTESILRPPPADDSVAQQSRRAGEEDGLGFVLGVGRESLSHDRLVDKQVQCRISTGGRFGPAAGLMAADQEDGS